MNRNNSSLQPGAIEPQEGASTDFILLVRLLEWATLSSGPFSKLRKGLFKNLSNALLCIGRQS